MRTTRAVNQQGFTIIELVIIIAVIISLAGITVLSYYHAKENTEISETTAAVQVYKKALLAYKTDKGAYLTTDSFCLGDQYGAFTGGSINACGVSTSQIAVNDGTTEREELRPYLDGQPPMPSPVVLHSGTTEFAGAVFHGTSYGYKLDGRPAVGIEYYVKGSTCTVGPVYTNAGPNFSSPATRRSQALSDGSRCFLILPVN